MIAPNAVSRSLHATALTLHTDMNKQENVKEILEEIRDNTATPWWRAAVNGLLYGAGWVIGTVFAIAALGWFLSLFGVIPGFGELTSRLQNIVQSNFR